MRSARFSRPVIRAYTSKRAIDAPKAHPWVMRALQLVLACLLVAPASVAPSAVSSLPAGPADLATEAPAPLPPSRQPVLFEQNVGQADPAVRFISRIGTQRVFFTDSEIVFVTARPEEGKRTPEPDGDELSSLGLQEHSRTEVGSVLRMSFIGANPSSQTTGREIAVTKTNYIRSNDPGQWHTGIANYKELFYHNIYEGIDLVFYGAESGELEYDFIVSPETDPNSIAMSFTGADELEIDDAGDLVITAGQQSYVQRAPMSYQGERASPRAQVESRYILDGKKIGFELGDYDRTKPLVIDPVLTYSTYLGGTFGDEGNGIAVDITGSAYVVGTTTSADFPLANAYDSTLTGTAVFPSDAFITKLAPDGASLIYSTYFGGSGWEIPSDVGVDSAGNAVAVGYTTSPDFPTVNAIQDALGPDELATFAMKFAADGLSLTFSTYINESNTTDVEVTAEGETYLVGGANSGFPVVGGFQPVCNWPWPAGCDVSGDAFVMHMNPTGGVVYSSYLGGSGGDVANDIAADASGSVYVTGYTWSLDFPTTPGVFQPAKANVVASDAFVTKISPDGSSMVYSTYLGGVWQDKAYGIDVDSEGAAYVVGDTDSPNFPTASPYDPNLSGPGDAFVTKVSPMGDLLVYSTYFGGAGGESARGVAVDWAGEATVAGITRGSSDFPVVDPIGVIAGAYRDTFISRFNAAGSALTFSTPLGGARDEVISGFAMGDSSSIYFTGWTDSVDYPVTPGGLQQACGDCADPNYVPTAFVSKISEPASTSYLVEGATSGDFDTWILVANPSLTETVVARIDFLTETGRIFGPHVTIPPSSRRSVKVDDYIESFYVSSVVYGIGGPVIAERATYGSDPSHAGAHLSKAIETLAGEWFLTEGATSGGFDTWVLVANPSLTLTATVESTFFTDTGPLAGPTLPVGPGKRVSIKADDYVDTYHVSTRITSTGTPVAVERTSYVDRTFMTGATSAPGAMGPKNTWYLTEGATKAGFETWILLANPDEAITSVATLNFLTDIGDVTGPVVSVPPGSRRSIRVNDYTQTYDVATSVSATGSGVIAERAMYSDHLRLGKSAASGEGEGAPAYEWVLAEGATAGGYETWVLITNPDPTTAASVDITYMTNTGAIPGPTGLAVPPRSRKSVLVNASVSTYDVSTRVKVASGPPVSVERTVYMPPGPGQDSTSGPGYAVG